MCLLLRVLTKNVSNQKENDDMVERATIFLCGPGSKKPTSGKENYVGHCFSGPHNLVPWCCFSQEWLFFDHCYPTRRTTIVVVFFFQGVCLGGPVPGRTALCLYTRCYGDVMCGQAPMMFILFKTEIGKKGVYFFIVFMAFLARTHVSPSQNTCVF